LTTNPLDETKIQYALHCELMRRGQYCVIPNVSWSWLYWEADLISITKSFYMYEYEIKISHQDFKADFRKRKHYSLRRDYSSVNWKEIRIPNYFSYVAPLEAVPICIPDYAGLILVDIDKSYAHKLNFVEVQKPKRIHGQKQTEKGIIAMLRTLMFKYWGLASERAF